MVRVTALCYPQVERKQNFNEWINKKSQKCTCLPNVLVFLSKPERTYRGLTPGLETVSIEVSTVQVLRLELIHGDFTGSNICH